MKNLFIKIALFTLIIITGEVSFSQSCVTESNIHNFTYNSKSYQIVKELKNRALAGNCAVNEGGYLVEINDLAEQNAIYNEIVNNSGISSTYTTVNDGGGIAYIWIGASDVNTEGTWVWDNSTTNFWTGQGSAGANNGVVVGGLYNNWGGSAVGPPKEPDNFSNNQNGGAIALAGWPAFNPGLLGIAGEWNDINTTNQLYYIVEYDCLLSFATDTQAACGSYTWIDGNTYTDDNNTATHHLINATGCDSIVTLDLTITKTYLSLFSSDTAENYLLTSAQNNANYQWLDCNTNFNSILNETNQSYTVTVNGNYALEITYNGCIDTTDCISFTTIGMYEKIKSHTSNIYPNPSKGDFLIDLGKEYQSINIKINTITGSTVAEYSFKNRQQIKLLLEEKKGVYFVEIKTNKGKEVIKVIVD